MTDTQKGVCLLLTAFFLVMMAVGDQTSSGGSAGGLCYLGSYIAGFIGLMHLVRGFFGGHDAAEEQQLGE